MAILGTEGCSSPDLQQPNSLCKPSCLPQHCPLGYEGMAFVCQRLLRIFSLCCGMTAAFIFKCRNGHMSRSGPKLVLLLFGSACGLTAGPVKRIPIAASDLPWFPCLLPLCVMLRKDMKPVQILAQPGGLVSGHGAEEVWLPFLLSQYCNPEMKPTSILLNKSAGVDSCPQDKGH